MFVLNAEKAIIQWAQLVNHVWTTVKSVPVPLTVLSARGDIHLVIKVYADHMVEVDVPARMKMG